MKLAEFGNRKKEKKPQVTNGSWTDSREQFVGLKPLNLLALSDNVMVCNIAHRPYLSRIARESGITYTTIAIGESQMMVLCYKVSKKGKKNEVE